VKKLLRSCRDKFRLNKIKREIKLSRSKEIFKMEVFKDIQKVKDKEQIDCRLKIKG